MGSVGEKAHLPRDFLWGFATARFVRCPCSLERLAYIFPAIKSKELHMKMAEAIPYGMLSAGNQAKLRMAPVAM
jgi:hypothetical protein